MIGQTQRKRPQAALILGANSAIGRHLTSAINRHSVRHRVVAGRVELSEEPLVELFPERSLADPNDADVLTQALAGFELVYDCLPVPVESIDRYPTIARNVAAAAVRAGVKIVHVSNYWSYLPLAYSPLDEEHPREGGSDWVKLRREGEDALLAAGAAVAHLPEIFGPHVYSGVVQRAIEQAHAGEKIRWEGSSSVEREYAYAPDAMEAVVRLSYAPEAYGERWIVGGSGPLTGDALAEIAGQALNRKVAISSRGSLILGTRALLSPRMRTALRMMPYDFQPIRFNGAKLEALIGNVPTHSYARGVARTLEWFERRRLVK